MSFPSDAGVELQPLQSQRTSQPQPQPHKSHAAASKPPHSDADDGRWSGDDSDYGVDEERGEGGRKARGRSVKVRSKPRRFLQRSLRLVCTLLSTLLAPLLAFGTTVRAFVGASSARLLRIPLVKRVWDWASPVRARLLALDRRKLLALWLIKLLLTASFLWLFTDSVPAVGPNGLVGELAMVDAPMLAEPATLQLAPLQLSASTDLNKGAELSSDDGDEDAEEVTEPE